MVASTWHLERILFSMTEYPTDEDLQIARLRIHRDLVGWVILALAAAGIPAERTKGNSANGDIRLLDSTDVIRAKERLRELHQQLGGEASNLTARTSEGVYIEIKAYSGTPVTSGLARLWIEKQTILGIVTTTTITQPAKNLLNEADIAWIERFPESELESSAAEE